MVFMCQGCCECGSRHVVMDDRVLVVHRSWDGREMMEELLGSVCLN